MRHACLLAIFLLTVSQSNLSLATDTPSLPPPTNYTIYLPIIRVFDSFSQTPIIWAHTEIPAAHEVALFKHTFTSAEILTGAEIQLFADTRYELWLDGVWLGRGPARFTRNYREYDRYQLERLQAGEHTLAVLVQWAPNTRRSESLSPGLQLRLLQSGKDTSSILAITGPHWLSQLSLAWQTHSADIAPANLIGPSELLDLRELPSNWFLSDESSQGWQPAIVRKADDFETSIASAMPQVVLDLNQDNQPEMIQIQTAQTGVDNLSIQYQPRSIPLLSESPVTTTMLDAGLIYPGFLIGEISSTQAAPYALNFQASQAALFTIEVLNNEPPPEDFIQLDQSNLSWTMVGSERPDVYASQTLLQVGEHTINFTEIPTDGLTFAVSSDLFQYPEFPFEQGLHAGRRNLLANLVSDPNSIEMSPATQGLSVVFNTTPTYLVLDLGRTIHGRLSAEISGPSGSVVDIGWDERLHLNQRPLPYPGALFPGWNQVDSWILDGNSRRISTLDNRSGRYILITAWGDAPIQLDQLQILAEGSPLQQVGSFNSSDPRLNQIWQIGVDSLLPNLTDALTDTPWRERGQWWGDAYTADQIAQVSLGETTLIRRGLILMAQTMQTDPAPAMAPHNDGMHLLDYSMLWVHSLAEYAQRNADNGLVDQLYPSLIQFMAYLESLESPTTHLISLPKLHWSQTAYIDPRCSECRYGQSTPLNALYYSTLQQAAQLAIMRGDLISAQSWLDKTQTIKHSINQLLYLPLEQRFATSFYEGQWLEPGPHAQAWALAYDLVETENIPAVTNALLELLSQDPENPNLEIYGMYWVLKALGKHGYIQPALQIIERYYGNLLNKGASTWWENFNADQHRFNTLSHAWGGAPTWFLSTYLAGFEQTGPASFRWQPALTSLPTLSAKAPLAENTIELSWQTLECSRVQLIINIPPGIQGEFSLPDDKDYHQLSLDGETIWELVAGHNLAGRTILKLIPLNPGSHTIILEMTCSDISQ